MKNGFKGKLQIVKADDYYEDEASGEGHFYRYKGELDGTGMIVSVECIWIIHSDYRMRCMQCFQDLYL